MNTYAKGTPGIALRRDMADTVFTSGNNAAITWSIKMAKDLFITVVFSIMIAGLSLAVILAAVIINPAILLAAVILAACIVFLFDKWEAH